MGNKKTNQTFFEQAKRFFEPISQNKVVFGKGFFVSFLWGINAIVHVLFLERILYYLESGFQVTFTVILGYYLIYILSYEIINFSVKKWGWVEAMPRTWITLCENYLKKYILLDNNRVEIEGTGKMISIIYGGIRQWGFLLWNSVELGLKVLVSMIFGFYMLSNINNYYAWLFFILFTVFFLISVYFSTQLQPYRRKRNDNMNIISKQITKVLMGKNEILQTNNISRELHSIIDGYKIDESINKDMGVKRTFMNRNSDFGLGLLVIGTYYILGNLYFTGDIQLHIIVGFGGAFVLMQRSIWEALSFYIQFSKEWVVIEKLWDFFDTTPEIQGYDTGSEFTHKTGSITLNNINYGYDSNNPVFQNFSLTLPGSQVTALVGPSGGGKSTLVKLIAGYIRADSGEVIIDDQKLSDVSLKSYYKDIGYLTQEPSVFDGSILENLTYALENTQTTGQAQDLPLHENPKTDTRRGTPCGYPESSKHLNHIIKLAKCEFIYDFPNGLDTEIGEKGIRLSGGQRQRLAIAKIFLKDPKIIILDEPTSALDSFSEEQITEAMHNLFKGRTVIIIAHRLQTVKSADDIILLENGEIKERGTHSELVKQKGMYKKMLDLQSGF